MRWSDSKSKTSTGKQTLGDSNDPTAATNMVAELGWVKGHMAWQTIPKMGDNNSFGAGRILGLALSASIIKILVESFSWIP